jgi:hypothetical protein
MKTDHFKGKDFWKVAVLHKNETWFYGTKICRSKGGAVNSFGRMSSVDFDTLKDIYLVSIRGEEILYTKKMVPKILSIANDSGSSQKKKAMNFIKERFPESFI